jgi:hypothetical protein
MKRELDYQFRVKEFMARAGMRNSRDLVEPLRDRGITYSESQIYRLVSQDPDRIAFKVLVALADIFDTDIGQLVTYTGRDVRTKRSIAVGGDVPLLESYRPVRARIVAEDEE